MLFLKQQQELVKSRKAKTVIYTTSFFFSFLDPFIKVLGPQDLNGTGMYFIGIKLSPSVKEIFKQFEYIPSMNYTLRTWETVCKVWDEDDKKFVTDWCKVSELFCQKEEFYSGITKDPSIRD